MQRELDPRLFGDENRNVSTNTVKKSEELMPPLERLPQDPSHLRAQLGRKDNMEMKMDSVISKVDENLRLMRNDITKIEKRFERFEQHYKSTYENMQKKLSSVEMRMTDRNMMENKIQSLIERQQSMIANFEMKLNAVRKLIEEKDVENMKLSASLREAKSELVRAGKY